METMAETETAPQHPARHTHAPAPMGAPLPLRWHTSPLTQPHPRAEHEQRRTPEASERRMQWNKRQARASTPVGLMRAHHIWGVRPELREIT